MAHFAKDASPSPTPDPKHMSAMTVIARDTRLVGELTGSRAMRVEGTVQGKVLLKAPLEVAEGATVEAEIQATTVRVGGTVTGNVTATELVELLAHARVKGDITAPAIHVVEGARLEGRVQMRVDEAAKAAPAEAKQH